MDPITHVLVGGLSAKTAKVSRRRFWVMMFLGAAPDLDVIFNYFGSWAYWLQHRGISHSVSGIAFQALLYSWLFRKWDLGTFRTRAWHYFLPLALHSFCDLLTSYGVPLLSPFTYKDYSINLVGGLALLPIVFMSVGLFWITKKDIHGWKATRPLWMGWALYLMMSISGKAYAAKLLDSHDSSLTTLPSVTNPFMWTAIDAGHSASAYEHYKVNLFDGVVSAASPFSKPGHDGPVQQSMASSEVQRFLTEARWPMARVSKLNDGWVVDWGQLLFSTRGSVRGKIQVILNKEGNIISEKKIFGFWNADSAA